ncbi:MAG: DUF554 domain-containing protein [Clostridia bacterium]|nr:DUF554 domain-containing protein [Clostridia bacterium]
MLGTLANVAAILVGGCIGLLIKKGVPQRLADTIMGGVALCVLLIGIQGALGSDNTLLVILSVVLGGALGTLLDLNGKLERLGDFAQRKFAKDSDTFAQGFVSASILFCVGAMAVVGSLESGLKNDHATLLAKSLLDGITSVILASSLGAGVLLSALPILLYQGGITLLAGVLAPVLGTAVVAEMSAVGSLLIVMIGLNMLKLTELKIADYLPAIFLPLLLIRFF